MGRDWTWNEVIGSLDASELDLLRVNFESVTGSTQNSRKDQLREAYERQGLALVLGAGVSMAAGVPSWNQLLSNLVLGAVHQKLEPGRPVTDNYRAFTAVLERCLPVDALVVAHYVKRVLLDRGFPAERFTSVLREELYRDTPTDQSPPEKTRLLDELANLTRGSRWDRQSGVKEVITYNFDTLFEEALDRVECPRVSPPRNRRANQHGVPVYHPHGIIHRTEDPGDWAILSEDDYHAEFAAPHSWSNVVQLNAFSQLRCVFVGLSMTDPNLRRLLGAARGADEPQHFAFLRRNQLDSLRERIEHEFRWAATGRPANSNLIQLDSSLKTACLGGDTATDLTLQALGVQVIWFDQFAELPGLIRQMISTKKTAVPGSVLPSSPPASVQ